MCDLEKFSEILPTKKTFYSSITGKTSAIEFQHVLKVWNKCDMKIMKITICT